MAMKRRHFLLTALAMAAAPAALAANPPWSARLLKGGFDGKVWWSGLHITLASPWKTYWRVPGEGGIAPDLKLHGDNIADRKLLFPLPQRYEDEAGMVIGYKTEVVLPFSLEPMDANTPVVLDFKSFFGVCEVVCIPAQHDAVLTFDPARSDAPDQALISQWQKRVPVFALEGPVIKAKATLEDGKPHLLLDMLAAVDDIFVEGGPTLYFGKPRLMRGLASLPVSGAKTIDELRGGQVRLTMDAGGRGLEQMVAVV